MFPWRQEKQEGCSDGSSSGSVVRLRNEAMLYKGCGRRGRFVLIQSHKGANSGQPGVCPATMGIARTYSQQRQASWLSSYRWWRGGNFEVISVSSAPVIPISSTEALIPPASVSSSLKWVFTHLPNNRMIVIKIGASKRKAVSFPNSKEAERLWIIWIQRNQIILWSNKSFRLLLWEPSHRLRKTMNSNLIHSHLKGGKMTFTRSAGVSQLVVVVLQTLLSHSSRFLLIWEENSA